MSYPTPEDHASEYNAFETPSSKAAIDLRPCHAFCGPNRRPELHRMPRPNDWLRLRAFGRSRCPENRAEQESCLGCLLHTKPSRTNLQPSLQRFVGFGNSSYWVPSYLLRSCASPPNIVVQFVHIRHRQIPERDSSFGRPPHRANRLQSGAQWTGDKRCGA